MLSCCSGKNSVQRIAKFLTYKQRSSSVVIGGGDVSQKVRSGEKADARVKTIIRGILVEEINWKAPEVNKCGLMK